MINENFVYLGVLLNLIGGLKYIWDTLQGRTKPNQVTWFLWALAPMVAFTAMIGQGVRIQASLLTFMVGFNPLLIFIVSFMNKKSVWRLTKFDIICGCLSLLGIVGWALTRQGDVAILFSIMADALAALPTLVKSWKEPESESWLVFLNGAASALITLLTLTVWDFRHVGFTLYIFLIAILLFVLIKFRLGPKLSRLLKTISREDKKETI